MSCSFLCVRFILYACACVTFSATASSAVIGPDTDIDQSFIDTRFAALAQSGFSGSFEHLKVSALSGTLRGGRVLNLAC